MDFDKQIDRYGTYCDKWDYLERYYGEKGMLGLWVADIDFAVPQAVSDAILKRAQHPIYGYTEPDDDYYDPMIAWYKTHTGFQIEKDWITYTCGVIPAVAFLIQAFSQEGDKVIIQEPVYHPFKKAIVDNNRVPLINELHADGKHYTMDLEDLERQIDERTKIMILCNPHNPVGRVWKREELLAVGNLCRRHHILVISDEIHSDIVFRGNKHIPFPSLGKEYGDICVMCNAPNKTFNIAGLQGANIIIPNQQIRETYQAHLKKFHLSGPTPFTLEATKTAYEQGEAWYQQLIAYLEENIALVERFFPEKCPSVKVISPEGTYMVWLDFRGTGLSTDQINETLIHKAKVALNDGAMFGKSGESFQRMNVACPRATLREALERIAAAFNET